VGRASQTATWTAPRLTSENREFLDRLPLSFVVDGRFLMVHGSLYPEPNEEIYLHSVPETLQKNFNVLIHHEAHVRIGFFGHTHQCMVHRSVGDSIRMAEPGEIHLDPAGIYLINPGSVGQSRDADPRASFLTYDTDGEAVCFHRVAYDRDACLKKARRAGLLRPPPLLRSFVVRVLEKMGIKRFVKRIWLKR
jgi:diadenosine tetraphosphatase ApaH/serine/threonine PP2A family protein phosphatase